MPVETSQQSNTSAGGSDDFTRLHITPLDPELLRIVVPAAVLPRARNISYHSIETFPEKRYGFVELPPADAEKIAKKLNGSILRGSKMKVEKARPEERAEPTGEEDKVEKKKKKSKSADGSKKRKRETGVVEGVVLKDRKVKRGWTEAPDPNKRRNTKKDKDSKDKDKEKRKRTKSKYTEQEECLVKTVVPPNALKNLAEGDAPRKRKKGKSREVTVHEFEKTTKFPGFLKDSTAATDASSATEFVDGKGWVDADGKVVEPVKHKTRPVAEPKVERKSKRKPEPVVDDEDDTSSSGTSSEDEDSSSDVESESEVEAAEAVSDEEADVASDEVTPEEKTQTPELRTPKSALKADSSRPTSSSSSKNLTIKIPPPATPASDKVHPLEALYKRPKPEASGEAQTPAPEAQPFSFFEAEEDEGEPLGQPVATVPMTPYTREEFEWRNVRSAAPTPDTAHPSRSQTFWSQEDDEEMEEQDEAEGEKEEEQPQPGSSDFQSWFWDNRRELNRSWMVRRKTVAKEKRHRENKARASKAV